MLCFPFLLFRSFLSRLLRTCAQPLRHSLQTGSTSVTVPVVPSLPRFSTPLNMRKKTVPYLSHFSLPSTHSLICARCVWVKLHWSACRVRLAVASPSSPSQHVSPPLPHTYRPASRFPTTHGFLCGWLKWTALCHLHPSIIPPTQHAHTPHERAITLSMLVTPALRFSDSSGGAVLSATRDEPVIAARVPR